MTKVLMIASQDIVNDLSDGGKHGSNRNWNLLCDVFGRENVWLIEFDKATRNGNAGTDIDDHILSLCPFHSIIDRALCILSGNFFENPHCDIRIVNCINQFNIDLVFIDRTLFGNLTGKIKKHTHAKIWLFSHNLEKDYVANKFRSNVLLSKLMSHVAFLSERKAVALCDKLFALTERDSHSYLELYKKKADYIIPTSFDDRFDESKLINIGQNVYIQPSKELLFIGSCFNANYDGIKWFVDNVMPSLPDYTLRIVGKNFEIKKKELERDNVDVIGTVGDLEPFYYADNIMVMPIFYGAGQKVKTAEAMMYGKTIIATEEALEGYSVTDIEGIHKCRTSTDFISAIQYEEMRPKQKYNYSVRDFFVSRFSYEVVSQQMQVIAVENLLLPECK